MGGQAGGPQALVVEQDRHRWPGDGAPGDLRERAQVGAERAHLPEDPGVGARVRNHRRVELLGTGDGCPPLEVHRALAAAGHVGERVAPQPAGRLGHVARLPVDRTRRVLHQQPGLAAAERAGEVGREGEIDLVRRVLRRQVVVGRDDVQLASPRPVVQLDEVAGHEVRCHRDAGAQPPQHLAFGAEAVEQFVGGEPLEVQRLRRVAEARRGPWRDHLRPVGVALRPERGAPRRVERVDVVAVAPAQPLPEGLRRDVAVAPRDVAAVLVPDVPQRERRMFGVPRRQRLGEAHRRGPVDRRARAERLAAAVPERAATGVDGQRLRVGGGEPRRRRRGRGRQVDPHAGAGEQVQHPVQPAELVAALGWLEVGPGEHADRREGHAGGPHELRVLGPHVLRPLFGVVVAAERQTRPTVVGRVGE